MNVVRQWLGNGREKGDRPAVQLRHDVLTWRGWLKGAAGVARALRAANVQRGDRILVAHPTSIEFVQSFFGIMAVGAVPVPVPAIAGWTRAETLTRRLERIVADAAPRAAIADTSTRRLLKRTAIIEPSAPTEDLTVDDLQPEDLAMIQYTSGSTGDPKGVVITHGNLSANVAGIASTAGIVDTDRVLSWLPLYHDMGLIGGLLVPAYVGALSDLMAPLEFLLSPSSWLRAISDRRATVTIAPNFAYSLVARKTREAEVASLDLRELRIAFNGAEPVDAETRRTFVERFRSVGFSETAYYPVYGLAEATLAAAFPPAGRAPLVDHVDRTALSKGVAAPAEDPSNAVALVSVGQALPGHTLTVRDPETQAVLAERRLGEVVLTGPSVSPGYFGAPPGDADLRTGDLGYLADGELYVVDRIKDLIIAAGRSYAPSDVEQTVEAHPDIRTGRSVAFGVWSEALATEELVVVAEVRPQLRLQLEAIRTAVQRTVEKEIGLTPIVALIRPHALDTTSSGKLMRRAAKARFLAGGFEDSAPHSSLHPTWLTKKLLKAVR